MENTKRQEELIAYLKQVHFASIAELAAQLYTSEATVRREVQVLEGRGALKRVYGGVVIAEYENTPVPLYLRDKENSASKEQIAAAAAAHVTDNMTVILDASSTVRRICKYIKGRRGVTVITNSLRVCEELKNTEVAVICTGGTLLPKRDCFVGHFAEALLRRVRADAVFFSSQGLGENGDITDSSQEEIALRRVMLESAKKQYFLCDSSKRGREYPFLLCNLSDVTLGIFDGAQ